MASNNAQTLSGTWTIAPDPNNIGYKTGWFNQVRPDAINAPVPGVIQQAMPGYHGVVWYWHTFRAVDGLGTDRAAGERILIRFGAVDYLCEVWMNGYHLGVYEGGETSFEFDVTDAIRWDRDNLLTVRVLNPTNTPIDGYLLEETPHKNKTLTLQPGSMLNTGGILSPVTLLRVPAVHIHNVFARPNPYSGDIDITITIFNSRTILAKGLITLEVCVPADGSDKLTSHTNECEFSLGESIHESRLHVHHPRLWDLEDPFLYWLKVTVQAEDEHAHQQSFRIGFRDLRIVDGYFHLNGRRIFLKSTHTGNHIPIGVVVPVNFDFVRRDLIYAKASGFNTVRFIAGACHPDQLDLCDELGLMVYEESMAAWNLSDSPHMSERFDRNTGDMIRRDRNHACVTIWGLLNETTNNSTYRHAVDYLSKLRILDPTRLVLLNSGRWDEEPSTGSVSNPGSDKWEHVWGVESPMPPVINPRGETDWTRHPPPGYVDRAGDMHIYPQVPLKPEATALMKQIGRDTKPVFLSEFGIGSLQNVIDEWRHWEQSGAPPLEEGAFLREQAEMFIADWKRLGFDDVYPFPEDMLQESQRLHARQRRLGFDIIRSNPRLNGYNLTGMLDHALTGEGLWTFFRKWKPSTFDAITDGWSPLRWCLMVDSSHVYAGRSITLEASLANENALKPGEYPVRFRVMGPHGVAWEKSLTLTIPDPVPLAVPVLYETIQINGQAGSYTFAANLERGGAPASSRLTFHVSDAAALPRLSGNVSMWGISPSAERWLSMYGLACQALGEYKLESRELILVGLPADPDRTLERMSDLTRRIYAGSTVIFLDPAVFSNGVDSTAYLPLVNRGKTYTATDWLYHKECVTRRHPVFTGLQSPGIMDWDYYGPVVPHKIYEGLDTPDEMIAASFTVGHHSYPTGYTWGLLIGAYRHGAGKIILSTPYILENLDVHPAADRLLLNLIHWASALE